MSPDLKALQLLVRGHVQGVFFRDCVRREAQRRGVSGWATNRSDGSVEIVLEGQPAHVRELAAFCRHGPRAARVDDVQISERAPQGLSGFRVR